MAGSDPAWVKYPSDTGTRLRVTAANHSCLARLLPLHSPIGNLLTEKQDDVKQPNQIKGGGRGG